MVHIDLTYRPKHIQWLYTKSNAIQNNHVSWRLVVFNYQNSYTMITATSQQVYLRRNPLLLAKRRQKIRSFWSRSSQPAAHASNTANSTSANAVSAVYTIYLQYKHLILASPPSSYRHFSLWRTTWDASTTPSSSLQIGPQLSHLLLDEES